MASGILQNGVHTNTPRVWLPFWFLGWIHKLLRPHNATGSKYKEKNLSICLSNSHHYVWKDLQVQLLSHAPSSGQALSWWRLPDHWQFSDETLGGWATAAAEFTTSGWDTSMWPDRWSNTDREPTGVTQPASLAVRAWRRTSICDVRATRVQPSH